MNLNLELITTIMVYIRYFYELFNKMLSAFMKGYGVEDSDVADLTWPWQAWVTTTAADESTTLPE